MGMKDPGLPAAQAGLALRRSPSPTRTPVRSPTPDPLQPTSTYIPYATPTPGPTTTVSGTWKIVSSPNVGTGTYGNKLNAVTVVSPNNGWAVGFSPAPSGTPLIYPAKPDRAMEWQQLECDHQPQPAGKTDVELNGVAAVSANDIWAVGHSGDPSTIPYQTLTEHWNGTSLEHHIQPKPRHVQWQ